MGRKRTYSRKKKRGVSATKMSNQLENSDTCPTDNPETLPASETDHEVTLESCETPAVAMKNETGNKCFISLLHMGDVNKCSDLSGRKHIVEDQLVSEKPVKDQTLGTTYNENPHVIFLKPYIQELERVETSSDNGKVHSGIVSKLVMDTTVSTDVRSKSGNSKIIKSDSDIKNDMYNDNLAAEQGRIGCSSQSSSNRSSEVNSRTLLSCNQILGSTDVKVEPSTDKENCYSMPNIDPAHNRTVDTDVFKSASLCTSPYKVKPGSETSNDVLSSGALVSDSSYSESASKNYGKKSLFKNGSNSTAANNGFENQKCLKNDAKVWNEDSAASGSSQSSSNGYCEVNSGAVLSYDQALGCTKVKVEPSTGKENSYSRTNIDPIPNKTLVTDNFKQVSMCSSCYEVKPSSEALSNDDLGSGALLSDPPYSESASENCGKNILVKNEKCFKGDVHEICNDDSDAPGSSSSPFNVSTFSLKPNEQEATEVIVSLPLEKLQMLIAGFAEMCSLNLRPVLQETGGEQSRPLSQNGQNSETTLHTSENKQVEECNQKTTESLELNVTSQKSFHDSKALEQNSKLELEHVNTDTLHNMYIQSGKSLENDQSCVLPTAVKHVFSVSAEDNSRILHSLPDEMEKNGIAIGPVSTAKTCSLHGNSEGNSADEVSGSRGNLLFPSSENVSNGRNSNSALKNGEGNSQNADTSVLKQSGEQIADSEADSVQLHNVEPVITSQPRNFHPGMVAFHSSEIQIKKEPEDSSLLRDIGSPCSSESGMNSSVDINKLMSVETLKGILEAVSCHQEQLVVPDTNDSESNCSMKNLINSVSCASSSLADSVLTTGSVKKGSSLAGNDGCNESAEPYQVELLSPSTENTFLSVKTELNSRQPTYHSVCSDVIKMEQKLQNETAKNVGFGYEIKGNSHAFEAQDLQASERRNPGNDYGGYEVLKIDPSSIHNEDSSCSGTTVQVGDTEMKKRCQQFDAESSKRFKSAIKEVVTQFNQESNPCVNGFCNSHNKFSGKGTEENTENYYSLSLNKESCNFTTSENINANIRSKECDFSLDQNSEEFHNRSLRSCTPSSEKGQVDASEIGDCLHKKSLPEIRAEVNSVKNELDQACTAESKSYPVHLSTTGASKVQRFASRSSFLTNEMLDGTSKIMYKQQKMPKEEKNQSDTDFDAYLVVKTLPEHADVLVNRKRKIQVVINRDLKKTKLISNQDSINSNQSARLNIKEYKEKYKKSVGCAEPEKHSQFPVTVGNCNNQCPNMHDTKSDWNYSSSASRNQHSLLEHNRISRYANFLPFSGAPFAQSPYCSNSATPVRPPPQYLPPHARFSVPTHPPNQNIPTTVVYPQTPLQYPRVHSYPVQYPFPNAPQAARLMCPSHIWTNSVTGLHHSQAVLSPVHSVSSPTVREATKTATVHPPLPVDTSENVSSPLLPQLSPAKPSRLKPVQSESVLSAEPKNSCCLPDCKNAETFHGKALSTSQICTSKHKSVTDNSVLSLKTPALEVNSSTKKHGSAVNRSRTSRNIETSSKPDVMACYDVRKSPSNDFLSSILIWRVSWHSEQLQVPDPTTLIHKLQRAHSLYGSYKDYYNMCISCLLLETWELIFQAWKLEKRFHIFSCQLKHYEKVGELYEVHFETIVSGSDFSGRKFPVEGHLIVIKFGLIPKGSTRIYGYVSKQSSRPFSSTTDPDHPCYRGRNSNLVDDRVLLLTVNTAWVGANIDKSALIGVQVLHSLKRAVKQCDALVDLQYSPLIDAVLSPGSSTCKLISLSKQKNSDDNHTIEEIIYAILCPGPQVVVVEAVPGKDKINALVSIIHYLKALETADEKVKLLFCSQSDVELDSVGCRLVYPGDDLGKKNRLRCVRLGNLTDVDLKIKKISIHTLVDEYVEVQKQKELRDCEQVIKELSSKICATQADICTLKKHSSVLPTKLEKKLLEYQKDFLRETAKKDNLSEHQKLLQLQHMSQYVLLNSSEVILTTVADCHQLNDVNVLGKRSGIQRTCCIIDDAGRFTELETLPTLINGVRKLILVGDPDSAPRVHSKLMKKLNFNSSYFGRVRNQVRTK